MRVQWCCAPLSWRRPERLLPSGRRMTRVTAVEVIESETTTAELGEVTHPWTTVALDCARMQAYLPKGESMPGTAFIEQYFPQTQVAMNKSRRCGSRTKFLSASMSLRQRSNCTGISNQEARVTRRSCWVRCWSRYGRQGSSYIPCHIDGIRWWVAAVLTAGASDRDRLRRLSLVDNCYQS